MTSNYNYRSNVTAMRLTNTVGDPLSIDGEGVGGAHIECPVTVIQ